MKTLGTLMAAAMIFAGTATFAAKPVHAAKATAKTTTVNAKQEKPKPAAAPHAKKAHKKHHHAKKAAK